MLEAYNILFMVIKSNKILIFINLNLKVYRIIKKYQLNN